MLIYYRKKKLHQLLASHAAIVVFGATLIPSVHAQDASKSRIAAALEEIVVMATKKSSGEAIQDAPIAVSAFSQEEMALTKANNLSDLSAKLPNVELSGGGTFGGVANFSSRGFGINATTVSVEPAVGTFIDGIYIGTNYGVVTDFLDVGSVEVLRGPQGLLFGRNVTGGAVLINNARPSEDFMARLTARYETGLEQTYSGVINGKLTDTISARAAIRYSDDDGYFSNKAPGQSDYGQMETKIFRPSILFTPNDSSEYMVMFESGSMSGDGAIATSRALFDDHDVGIEELVGTDAAWTDIEWSQLTFESQWDVAFGDGTITNIFGWREVESDTVVDIATSPQVYSGSGSYVDQDQWSNELRYNGAFGNVDVTAGLYYFTQDIFNLTANRNAAGQYSRVGGGDLEHESYGAFTSVDYRLNDEVILIAGVRYSDETKDVKIRTRIDNACNWNDRSCVYRQGDAQSDNWKTWSPKVGFRWEAIEDLNFYGYYAKGYRSGGFNLRQTGALAGGPLAPGYDQEEQDAFELGMKSTFNDGKTRLNAALFYSEIDGLQKDVALPSPVEGVLFPQVAANTADATSKGVEIELSHQITDTLLLSMVYGHIDAKYTDVLFDLSGNGVVGSEDKALDLTRTPKNSGSVSLTHEHLMDSGASLVSRASWSSKSKQYTMDSNALAIPSRDTIDLFTTYFSSDDVWSLSLYVKNVTDKQVYSVSSVLPGNLGGDFSVLEKGRRFGLEVDYKFF